MHAVPFHTSSHLVNCQKACKKCDDGRPCNRCIKYGIEHSCVDSQRKPRKRTKRGPYSANKNTEKQDFADFYPSVDPSLLYSTETLGESLIPQIDMSIYQQPNRQLEIKRATSVPPESMINSYQMPLQQDLSLAYPAQQTPALRLCNPYTRFPMPRSVSVASTPNTPVVAIIPVPVDSNGVPVMQEQSAYPCFYVPEEQVSQSLSWQDICKRGFQENFNDAFCGLSRNNSTELVFDLQNSSSLPERQATPGIALSSKLNVLSQLCTVALNQYDGSSQPNSKPQSEIGSDKDKDNDPDATEVEDSKVESTLS
ncbi:hypothetical protein ROZALSC1DRAFT_22043 [Rozella allomycis CSF55]|uniref:Zn(2)-C6 fungal-type domain-containing protein n=1 Tax=Rozella allomycis (strain CSF55) TaxID=988480 RepID=A0A4P9YJF6_ROZAC|nr:hypothetical protein ROZALSC1DRAFT_22043 [Rozella allomycis CSF55]